MPGLVDHVVASLLLLALPAWMAVYGRAELDDLARRPHLRLRRYRTTIAAQWMGCGLILVWWWAQARSWSGLGLGLPIGPGIVIVATLTGAVGWLLWTQLTRVRRSPAAAAVFREQLRGKESFVPVTHSEVRTVQVMSVTAGVCEEIACRGFLLWYLATYMPLAAAIAMMAAAFGLMHVYQGVRAALQIAGLAVVVALFYVISGSLWLPILLHVMVDLSQFSMARSVLQAPGEARPITQALG